jgi:hypothetical protein
MYGKGITIYYLEVSKMIKFESECVDCPNEIGCLGDSCPKHNIPQLICDCCGEDVEELYGYDGEQLCKDCLLDAVPKVEI